MKHDHEYMIKSHFDLNEIQSIFRFYTIIIKIIILCRVDDDDDGVVYKSVIKIAHIIKLTPTPSSN